MHESQEHACPRQGRAEALAEIASGETLSPEVEARLVHCSACRADFRRRVAGRFPDISGYTILRELGRGGFGAVYKAIHHAKQRIEALKALFRHSPGASAYFENEVHLIAGLRHPDIATLYDARLDESPAYYSMEFVEGEELDPYLRAHTPSLGQRIDIIRRTALAIGYAHQQGVIHRDLKPRNILITAKGEPRIIDFGIARRLRLENEAKEGRDEPSNEGAVGTLGYIAPEQLAGRAVDGRADIYALGALLYHCLTGEPARAVTHPARIEQALRERRLADAADLAAIIARCVANDPAERYPTGEALADDLRNFAERLPVAARVHRPLGYRAARLATYLLHRRPGALRAAVCVMTALLLAPTYDALSTHWRTAGAGPGVTLIRFDEDTLADLQAGRFDDDAPGMTPDDRGSWRTLHGRLMERLGEAAPLVIAWDYYFERCRPEVDDAFIRGVRAAGAPVVIGAARTDINGAPLACSTLAEAVAGIGALINPSPISGLNALPVTWAIQPGYDLPIPSLSVAAYAASRFPDSSPDLRIDEPDNALQIRYVRKNPPPGERRFRDEVDTLRYFKRVDGSRPDERYTLGSIQMTSLDPDALRSVSYAAALRADTEQLRAWFAGRAIVIGQTFPGVDEYTRPDGRSAFGCQVHAAALHELLGYARLHVYSRGELMLRALLYCGLATILATFAVRIGLRVPATRLVLACIGVVAIGLLGAPASGAALHSRWALEIAIAASAMLTAGGLALLIETLIERQFLLASQVWRDETDTIPSTLIAETATLAPKPTSPRSASADGLVMPKAETDSHTILKRTGARDML